MVDLLVAGGLAEFYARAWWRPELRDYLAEHAIDLEAALPHVGAIGMMDVVEHSDDRFDFRQQPSRQRGETITSLVFEALDADERPFDLVALPIGQPERPMTLLGRVGFLAPAKVLSPSSYTMGKALPVHRHARDWLKAGCRGTAIIRPDITAREMLDVPGRLVAADWAHARELKRIAESVVDLSRIIAPETVRVAA